MLDIAIQNAELLAVLAAADKVVPRKPTQPIFGNILLEATESGVVVSATDGDVAFTGRCAAISTVTGQVTLPSRTLFDLLKTLPSSAEVRLTENASGASLAGAGFRAKLQTEPVADFPSLPSSPEAASVVSIPASWLATAIKQVRFAVAGGDQRYYLAGSLLELTTEFVRMVGSDSHRMAMATGASVGAAASRILPIKTLAALALILDDYAVDVPVSYTQGENHLFFDIGQTRLISRVIDAKYPAYRRVIPAPVDFSVLVDRMALLSALKRLDMLANAMTREVSFSVSGSLLRVESSSAKVGDGVEELPINYSGEPFTTILNGVYVSDFLDAAKTDVVGLMTAGGRLGVRWFTPDDDYNYVMMPVVK
jgi:DNA polymerase-3 subunit beta